MLDFRFEEKPAFLNLLQQEARRDDDLVPGLKTAQALDRGKGHQGVNADGVYDLVALGDGNEVNRPILDPGRHIVRYQAMA